MKLRAVFYLVIIALFAILPDTTAASSKIPSGTKIANILVENKKSTEIHTLLESEITNWQAKDDIISESEFETITFSKDIFIFNIDATVNELEEKTKRKLSTFFQRPKNVYVPLQVEIDEEHTDLVAIKNKSYIDYDVFINDLRKLAVDLEDRTLTIPYVEGKEVPLETIAEVELDLPKLSNATLDYLVTELDGSFIGPNELFSFLDSIETPERLVNSSEESSFLATGLYELFLQTDFEIVSRTQQAKLPDYGEKGINALVDKKENKDFIVLNDSDSTYRLKVKKTKDKIIFSLEGNEPKYTYDIEVNNEKEIKPRTIYRYSKRITPGEHEVVQPGKDGLALQVVRSTYEDGEFVSESIISRDVYLPKPLILLVSPDDPEIIEDNIEINLDGEGSLFKEEITIDQEGNLIRPDGSVGGSILDLLPDNLDNQNAKSIIDQILRADKQQQQYNDFFNALFEGMDELTKTENAQLEQLEAQVLLLEMQMLVLATQLFESGTINQAEYTKNLEKIINKTHLEQFNKGKKINGIEDLKELEDAMKELEKAAKELEEFANTLEVGK